ncbi:MAG: ATP-binding protein [Candidatus Omnitrophica bacterium]|nr:ATP-binding protein [Candidatus Omnitrophota bacterium]
MNIPRIYDDLNKYLKPNKALILYGSRQVGKTTLLNKFLSQTSYRYKLDSGDNIKTQNVLGSRDFALIKEYAQGYDLIAVDEAQKIPSVGTGIKIIVDQMPGVMVIATGSSSFELAGQIGEPLTGRKNTLALYPISQLELIKLHNRCELKDRLEDFLVFGAYPEVVTAESKIDKIRIIEEISQSYLFKDILQLDKIRNSKILLDLVRLLAFQIGNEVSLSEIAKQLGIDYKTVGRYLDLLEKSFIIYNLRGFSRNLRSEIIKKSKYYFIDNGIRNAIISNFNSLELRNDIGALWENFLFIERLKKRTYKNIYANNYFWRTWTQKEIDLVEERDGKLFAFEFKWGKTRVKPPKDWVQAYPESEFMVINQENYLDFIT